MPRYRRNDEDDSITDIKRAASQKTQTDSMSWKTETQFLDFDAGQSKETKEG